MIVLIFLDHDKAKISDIELNFKGITQLPNSIASLLSLDALGVACNRLSHLPQSIGNLRFLTYLDVSENELIDIPNSIGNLKSLCHLLVNNNRLTQLPESIKKLRNLEYISVWCNPVTSTKKSRHALERRFERGDLMVDCTGGGDDDYGDDTNY